MLLEGPVLLNKHHISWLKLIMHTDICIDDIEQIHWNGIAKVQVVAGEDSRNATPDELWRSPVLRRQVRNIFANCLLSWDMRHLFRRGLVHFLDVCLRWVHCGFKVSEIDSGAGDL